MFFAVALLDIGKGSAAAGLGLAVGGPTGAVVAGSGALIGHWRPLFLGFKRGGKIVATTVGVALVIAPLASVSWRCSGGWSCSPPVHLGASITASLALPPLVLVFGGTSPEVLFTVGARRRSSCSIAPTSTGSGGDREPVHAASPEPSARPPTPVAAAAASDRTPPVR